MSKKQSEDQIIRAIIEDRSVDWEDVSDTPDDETALLNSLRKLESIARAHKESEGRDLPFRSWGNLKLREYLGSGTYGEVYLAREASLDIDVVLKLFKTHLSTDPTRRQWLLEEARRLARIKHPNVIKVYGATVDRDRLGFWMDLLEGETLESYVQSRGNRLEAREAISTCRELAAALVAVHRGGIVHGDIKGTNVFRESFGRAVLMDFGSSALLGEGQEVRGVPRGTPLYMAPEVFREGRVDPRSDIYSLGVLLHRLITGEVPVKGMNKEQLAQAHRRRLKDPSLDMPGTPQKIQEVVAKCLAPNPEDRFQTAAETEEALISILQRRSKRLAWIASLATAAAVTLALVGRFGGDPDPLISLNDARQITLSGNTLTAQWHPKENKLAYSDGRQIVITDPLGTSSKKVCDTKELLAPDHSGVVGVAWWPKKNSLFAVTWNMVDEGKAFQVPLDGSAPRLLKDKANGYSFDWGNRLYYFSREGPPSSWNKLFEQDLETGERSVFLEPLEEGGGVGGLSFSPTGRRAVFVAWPPKGLWLLEPHTGSRSPLSLEGFDFHEYSTWTPDGRGVLVTGKNEQGFGVWMVPADSGSPVNLVMDEQGVGYPALSPDGKWFSFRRFAWAHTFVILDAESGDLADSPETNLPHANAAFDPAGEGIYFQAILENEHQIWRWAEGSGEVERFIQEPGYCYGAPHFTAEGVLIVERWKRKDPWPPPSRRLYRYDRGDVIPIPMSEAVAATASSQRAGILFSANVTGTGGNQTVYWSDLENTYPVFTDTDSLQFVHFDHGIGDNEVLLATIKLDTDYFKIQSLSLRDTTITPLFDLPDVESRRRFSCRIALSPDRSQLAVILAAERGYSLYTVDMSDYELNKIGEYQTEGVPKKLTWNPSGTKLAVSIHNVRGNIFVVELPKALFPVKS